MSGQPAFSQPNPYHPGATGSQDWGASSYGPYPFQPPAPPRRSWGCGWILLLAAVLGGVPLICCGACGGVLMMGMELVEEEIARDLKTDPVIQQHLGEVKSVELHLWDSIMEEINHPTADDEESWYAFDVEGTKAKGRVVGKSVTNEDGEEELREGRLLLPGGQEFKLSK